MECVESHNLGRKRNGTSDGTITGWSVVIATRPIGTARARSLPTVLTGAREPLPRTLHEYTHFPTSLPATGVKTLFAFMVAVGI